MIDKAVELRSGSVSVAKGWHAEHFLCWIFGFFINLFIFLQVPHKFCCAPVSPLSDFFFWGGGQGTCPRQLYGAGTYGQFQWPWVTLEGGSKSFWQISIVTPKRFDLERRSLLWYTKGFDACVLTKSKLSSWDCIATGFLMKLFKEIILMLLKIVNYISDSACRVRNGRNEQRI